MFDSIMYPAFGFGNCYIVVLHIVNKKQIQFLLGLSHTISIALNTDVFDKGQVQLYKNWVKSKMDRAKKSYDCIKINHMLGNF